MQIIMKNIYMISETLESSVWNSSLSQVVNDDNVLRINQLLGLLRDELNSKNSTKRPTHGSQVEFFGVQLDSLEKKWSA